MPYTKFEDYIKGEGFCCPWACLRAREAWNTKSLSEDADITARGIRFWKEAYKKGELKCENLPSCLKARHKSP